MMNSLNMTVLLISVVLLFVLPIHASEPVSFLQNATLQPAHAPVAEPNRIPFHGIPASPGAAIAPPSSSFRATYEMQAFSSASPQQAFSQSATNAVDIAKNKTLLTPAQKKISSEILYVTADSDGIPSMEGRSIAGGNVAELVYAYVQLFPNATIQSIEPYVVNITNRDEENHLAAAWIDTTKAESLAALGGIKSIQAVVPPEVRAGSVSTEGDSIHRTADIRSLFGYRGSGVKVGVISNGVDHIAQSQATGDLPSGVHILSNALDGDEGTAMLEIVHDMAPDAELYFHDWGSNSIAFTSAIDDLKNAGCTVIVDDVGWFNEPYFEDGIVASHITSLLSENQIVYVSATGNEANKHYQGSYYNDGTNFMDFSQGGSAYKNLYLHLPPGGNVRVYLEWNDPWGASSNDYDLYLMDATDLSKILIQRNSSQTGTQNPYEALSYTNTGQSAIDAAIRVQNHQGLAATRTLEVFILPKTGTSVYTDNIVAADSIFGHPAVPDVISVAAVPASSPTSIEKFSSRGPVTIAYPSPLTRQKPDITGVNRVRVTGAGGFSSPFNGTSASAPHIAAIIAQIRGAYPTLTPAQIRYVLYSSAIDLGAGGRDTTFGYGRADALRMSDFIGYTGVVRSGQWILDYGTDGTVNRRFNYGLATDTPIIGDFDNDGRPDIGVFRSGQWILDYGMDGTVNRRFNYGMTTDIPLAGDFNNDRTTDTGVFRSGQWILDYGMDGTVNRRLNYGIATDTPIIGDFDNDGRPDIGVFRSGQWILDYGIDGTVNRRLNYGMTTDIPLAGDFNNDGTTDIGVFRSGQWILDYGMDGTVNRRFNYGLAIDIPLVGKSVNT